ncbi:MAG: transposase [Acidobacteria bacterium]|nr:transposase [Acidobacteriota bacterium]
MREEPRPAASAPVTCPHCGSKELSTSGKQDDANAYWRCASCGEVWNAARRSSTSRYR